MIIQDLIKGIHGTHKTEDNDITLQCNNGKVQTTKLFLASWSKFWKEILLGLEYSEDVVIVVDVDVSVLNKLGKFLSTGRINISGTQEYIEVIEGLEMLLPDLDLKDQQKLVMEDTNFEDEESVMDTDCDEYKYDVTENFICNLCLTYFSSKQKRDNHIENIHSKKNRYNCKVCAKIIFSKDGLVSHMKTHTHSSQHQCPDCKKIYRNESDLLKHFKSKGHSNESMRLRKFECSECDFTTNRVDSLYRHERNKHGLYNKKLDAISKTIERKGEVKCLKCDKKFTDTKLAEDHFTQESCEPIMCKDCGKEFNKTADLKLHIRDVHTENNFSCPSCDKVFKQKRNLNRHQKKCNPKETGSNDEIRKEVAHGKTSKTKKVNRNERKKLSKTDIKKLTENITEPDKEKKLDAITVCTKSKTFKQKLKKNKKMTELTKLEQSIENHLNSIEMKEDDYDDAEDDDYDDAEDNDYDDAEDND